MKNPAIEYVNINAAERTELVNDGLLPMPLGRASLGGYVYRGSAIRGLFGKFVNGDFGQETLNGQLYVATDPGGGSLPWPLERGFIFDKASETKAGFVKAIGQDGNGELYALTGEFDEFGQIDGRVFKIVDASITDDAPTNSTAPPTNSTAPRNNSTSAAGKHMVSWASLVTAAVIVFAM